MSPEELAIRKRLKHDLIHYAGKCLTISTKDQKLQPFTMNEVQLYVHNLLEQQKQRTGKVRAIVLKSRQQGLSTYIGARYFHQTTHRMGTRSFILTHHNDATNNLFEMTKRYYENLPYLVKPTIQKNNARELSFDKLDSGYKIATAGMRSIGRGTTIHLFHGSETAYYQNEDEIMAGAFQAVPDSPNTEIILESTSAGPRGMFYKIWQDAVAGSNEYLPIFSPWFWTKEYTKELPEHFELTNYEHELKNTFKISDEQIFWRRNKISTLLRGENQFKREYPNSAIEAFEAPNENAVWMQEWIHSIPKESIPPLKRKVVAIDPAGSKKKHSDKTGIIVAGLGYDDKVYILKDATDKYAPAEWATRSIQLYNQYSADLILAERNYGGDLVQYTLRSIDKNIAYKDVWARQSGHLRSEPVAHCYKRGEVYHTKGLDILEKSMITWDAYNGEHQPDEISALVYAITELKKLASPPLQEVYI